MTWYKNHPHNIVLYLTVVLSLVVSLSADENSDIETPFSGIENSVDIAIAAIASKKEEKIIEAPGVVSVITQDEIKRFGGTTLSDVLKRVPSFIGCTIYMTDRSVIASRGDQIGSSSSHILLLLNGRPMREVLEGGIKSEVYESFPVSVIKQIEVIRGPGSVLYGSQAFSAVINVITKSAENNKISVSGMLGERLKNNVMADLQYKIGDVGIVLAGRYADKGGMETRWKAPADPPGVYSGAVNQVDVTIPDYGPGFYGEIDYRDFRLMGSYNQWTNQNFVPLYEWLNTAGVIDGHTTGRIEWKKYFGDLGYEHKFTEWYDMTANVTWTRSLFETWEFPFISRDAYELLGEVTNFFRPVRNLNVLVGGVGGIMTGREKEKSLPGRTLDYHRGIYTDGHTGYNLSGYIQADYHWEMLKIIGGLQINKVRFKDSLDNVDDFDADFNPRIGVILYPLDRINIKALYSTAYRAPSLNELYLDMSLLAGKMTIREDPHFAFWDHEYSMEPEKVHTFDLSLNYQDGDVYFSINGFYSRMKNLIFSVFDTTRYSIPTWENYREATIFGLECEGKYNITKSLIFTGSFLFQENRDMKTGETNITPIPKFSAKGGLSYRADNGLTISAFNTFRQSVDPKYYDILNRSTKHFNMTNVHCSYDLNKLISFTSAKELLLVLDVNNLLNEEVWLPCWGEENGYTIPYIEGRTIYGGFKVSF